MQHSKAEDRAFVASASKKPVMPGVANFILRLVRYVWRRLPPRVVSTPPIQRLGSLIYDRYVRDTERVQSQFTQFLRNRPMLETVVSLVADQSQGKLRVTSVGCSTGAELYSLLYLLRCFRPGLPIEAHGIDVVEEAVEAARVGIYRDDRSAVRGPWSELSLLSPETLEAMFDPLTDGSFRAKDWLRELVHWRVGDATDARLLDTIGEQDLVLANNFLGPMEDRTAERVMRNLATLVAPNGLLVLDGVNLDLKSRVVRDLGFLPILDRFEEIYHADLSKRDWPWTRWSHEPIDRKKDDWRYRYAMIFRRA